MRRMVILAGFLVGCAYTLSGQELLNNTTFEVNLGGWSRNGAGSLVWFNSGHTGTRSCQHKDRTSASGGPYQLITTALNANGQGFYRASTWLYQNSGGPIVGRVQVGVKVTNVWTWTSITATIPHDTWTLVSGVPRLAWGAALQDSWFIVNTESATDNIWVDDCSFQRAKVDTPTITPNGGPHPSSVEVTLACATVGATIHYTTNETAVTTASPIYGGAFTLAESATVQALAVLDGWLNSAVASADFTISALPPVATPTITPDGGSHESSVEISFACTTEDAQIYYTTNGATPTAASTLYAAPFTLQAGATVKAIGVKSGMANSATASAIFTVTTAPPVITPDGGPFSGGVEVSLACLTPGATIHYTSDNTEPTTGGPVYAAPFTLRGSTTVRAYAVSAGRLDSPSAVAAFSTSPEPWASIALPGRLEAENFAAGNDGTAYNDTSNGNAGHVYRTGTSTQQIDIYPSADASGYIIGLVAAGEWMAYSADIRGTRGYTLIFRVSSGAVGTKVLRVEVDNVSVATCTFDDNLGYDTYFDAYVRGVMLPGGAHTLKVVFDTAGVNLNYIDFVPQTGTMIAIR